MPRRIRLEWSPAFWSKLPSSSSCALLGQLDECHLLGESAHTDRSTFDLLSMFIRAFISAASRIRLHKKNTSPEKGPAPCVATYISQARYNKYAGIAPCVMPEPSGGRGLGSRACAFGPTLQEAFVRVRTGKRAAGGGVWPDDWTQGHCSSLPSRVTCIIPSSLSRALRALSLYLIAARRPDDKARCWVGRGFCDEDLTPLATENARRSGTCLVGLVQSIGSYEILSLFLFD